jgi:hypothetical protein
MKLLNFLDGFSKKSQESNFIKFRPVGAELFHADRWTDMTKLIAAFRNLVLRRVLRIAKSDYWRYHVRLCVCPSARMEQPDSHWKDFDEI